MKKNKTDETEAVVTDAPAPIKRTRRKSDPRTIIKSLDATAIRARLVEIESEQAALRVLLGAADARDEACKIGRLIGDAPTAPSPEIVPPS